MRQTEIGTSFHPKAYLHLALIVMAGLLLLAVRGLILPHLSANDAPTVDWVLAGVIAIMLLSVFVTIRKNWKTYSLDPNGIVISHRILGTRRIPLEDVRSAQLVKIQGGRGYRYTSIALQLQDGRSTILDGLYNRGIEEFCHVLASKLR